MKKNKTKEQDSSNLSNNGNDNIEDNKVEEVVSDDDNDFNSDEDLKKDSFKAYNILCKNLIKLHKNRNI